MKKCGPTNCLYDEEEGKRKEEGGSKDNHPSGLQHGHDNENTF